MKNIDLSFEINSTSRWLLNFKKSTIEKNINEDILLAGSFLSLIKLNEIEKNNEETIDSLRQISESINFKVEEIDPILFTLFLSQLKLNKIEIPNELLKVSTMYLNNLPDVFLQDKKLSFLYNVNSSLIDKHIDRFDTQSARWFIDCDRESLRNEIYYILSLYVSSDQKIKNELDMYIEQNKYVLSGVLLSLCQDYDIELTSLLLALLKLSKVEECLYTDAVYFLNFQKRQDGSYGYINPFLNNDKVSDEDLNKNFYLNNIFITLFALTIGNHLG